MSSPLSGEGPLGVWFANPVAGIDLFINHSGRCYLHRQCWCCGGQHIRDAGRSRQPLQAVSLAEVGGLGDTLAEEAEKPSPVRGVLGRYDWMARAARPHLLVVGGLERGSMPLWCALTSWLPSG